MIWCDIVLLQDCLDFFPRVFLGGKWTCVPRSQQWSNLMSNCFSNLMATKTPTKIVISSPVDMVRFRNASHKNEIIHGPWSMTSSALKLVSNHWRSKRTLRTAESNPCFLENHSWLLILLGILSGFMIFGGLVNWCNKVISLTHMCLVVGSIIPVQDLSKWPVGSDLTLKICYVFYFAVWAAGIPGILRGFYGPLPHQYYRIR